MKRLALLTYLFFIAHGALAAGISVDHVWMRATAPGQQVASAYMDITSPVNATLVGAQSPAAGSIEMHTMRIDNGVMEMREIKSLALPGHKTVKLVPGGVHLMLQDLKQPFKAGERVPLRLTIEVAGKKRETVNTTIEVRNLGGQLIH